MLPRDWQQISAMTRDHNLYQNIVQSMFPTIHGNYYVCILIVWLHCFLPFMVITVSVWLKGMMSVNEEFF